MKTQKFILIDDNETFLEALKFLLISEYDAEIINEASNEVEINAIKNWGLADIIFMDVMMPGKNGIQLTKELLWNYGKLKIVAMTMHYDKVYLKSLLEAGFKGCIFKTELVNQLDNALQYVSEGKLYFPNNILLDFIS